MLIKKIKIVCFIALMSLMLYSCSDKQNVSTSGIFGDNIDNGSTGGGDSGGTGGDEEQELPMPTIIFVGTYEGIYYSEDNGTVWTKATSAKVNGADFAKISWSSFASDGKGTIVAGSYPFASSGQTNPSKGIIISHDWGQTWAKTSLTSGNFRSIVYMSDGLFVAGGDVRQTGVWRSTDGGKTWAKNSGGEEMPPTAQGNPPRNKGVGLASGGVFSITKLSETNLIAGSRNFGTNAYPSAIVVSYDKGETWFTPYDPPLLTMAYDILKHQDGTLSVAGSGKAGIHYTKDPVGNFWQCSSLNNMSFLSLTQLKSGTVLAGNSSDQTVAGGFASGIWRSPYNGQCRSYSETSMTKYDWPTLVGLRNGDALAGCSYEDNTAKLYCTGVWRSTDDGVNWVLIDNDLIKNKKVYGIKEFVKTNN